MEDVADNQRLKDVKFEVAIHATNGSRNMIPITYAHTTVSAPLA